MTAAVVDQIAGVSARDAAGRSALYGRLATGVAGDRGILRMLAELPPDKHQPNLLGRMADEIRASAGAMPLCSASASSSGRDVRSFISASAPDRTLRP